MLHSATKIHGFIGSRQRNKQNKTILPHGPLAAPRPQFENQWCKQCIMDLFLSLLCSEVVCKSLHMSTFSALPDWHGRAWGKASRRCTVSHEAIWSELWPRCRRTCCSVTSWTTHSACSLRGMGWCTPPRCTLNMNREVQAVKLTAQETNSINPSSVGKGFSPAQTEYQIQDRIQNRIWMYTDVIEWLTLGLSELHWVD